MNNLEISMENLNLHEELEIKENKILEYLYKKNLDGVILKRADNWAWITGGKNDRLIYSTDESFIDLIITKNLTKYCIASNVEEQRLIDEDFANLSYEIIAYPWFNPQERTNIIDRIIRNKRFASDWKINGTIELENDFKEMRFSLTNNELKKYRILGEWCREVVEGTLKQIKVGISVGGKF